MLAIKKILVPTDFSDCAHDALRLAVDLAARFGASVTLLHVYEVPAFPLADGTLAGPQVTEKFVGEIAAALDKARIEIGGAAPVTTQIVEGVPYVEITRVARDGHHDLIVLGTHGRTGLRHVLLGSVAERVVRTAPCPVLTTHGAAPAPELATTV